MRSRAKAGQSGPRYRVDYDADEKRMPRVVRSRRGVIRRLYRLATEIRIKLEREALAKRNDPRRLEEGEALRYLKDLPSVAAIADHILRGRRAARKQQREAASRL